MVAATFCSSRVHTARFEPVLPAYIKSEDAQGLCVNPLAAAKAVSREEDDPSPEV